MAIITVTNAFAVNGIVSVKKNQSRQKRRSRVKPIILKEGLRIDFTETKSNNLLNYIRFEYVLDEGCPTYIGAIDSSETKKLMKLKKVIDLYLRKTKKNRRGNE